LGGVPANETSAVSGEYMIDTAGFINLPNLGRLKIAGLTNGAAQSTIENAYKTKQVYTNPTIIITCKPSRAGLTSVGKLNHPNAFRLLRI
jgi:protein involved in polysaccharide export with SLBB domain